MRDSVPHESIGVRITRDEPDPMEINSAFNESHRSARETEHEASNILEADVGNADANTYAENETP